MTLIETLAGGTDSSAERALGERYLLGYAVQYVTVPSGTVHLRKPGARRTLCGSTINVDGIKAPRYHTDPGTLLTCNRCGQVVEKAGDRWAKRKRAK